LNPRLLHLLTLAVGYWLASENSKAASGSISLKEFGGLPVLMNGRIQPMDSVARNNLLQFRTKQTVALEGGPSITANQWLAEVMMKPALADTRKVFRIDHIELLGLLKLPTEDKYFAYNQFTNSLEEIAKQAQRVSQVGAKERSAFERQLLKLASAIRQYQRLRISISPEDSPDWPAELKEFQKLAGPGAAAVHAQQQGKEFDKAVLQRFAEFVNRYDAMAGEAAVLMIPPGPSMPKDGWRNTGAALMDIPRGGTIPPVVEFYARMTAAFRADNASEFNNALVAYQGWLAQNLPGELGKSGKEYFFNNFEPFYKATVLYLVAFLLICGFWVFWAEWLRKAAYGLLFLALAMHTFGLVFRMVLENRPPVTNLYSSAVFIGWGAVLLGIFLERFCRDGMGVIVSACLGFATQIIAHNLAMGGDTMEMMRAVLDNNFWLATHVVTITFGYSANFAAGLFAIFYLLRGVFTRSLTAASAVMLERIVYGIICFATFFSFIGTVLGGIWADQSWGRFWGWDPKENGALIIVLWNAAILHAHWDRLVQARGLMNMAIIGNIITSFSWFGVNMLGVGLHSYGFMDQAFMWLVIFITSQVVLIGVGLLPQSYWRSGKQLEPPKPGSLPPQAPQAARPA
jgi:ABC-type transport system involved in cytochrome c biogenesis permease subunit